MNCFDETIRDVILNLVTQVRGKYIAVVSCGLRFALKVADEEIKAEISPCGWQVWFPERRVEILNRNKECTSLPGKGGRPWRQNKSMNGAALKGSGEQSTTSSIHPVTQLSSIYRLLLWALSTDVFHFQSRAIVSSEGLGLLSPPL